jgi:death-on-curing protein
MPVWIEKRVVLVYHEELLAVHGGAAGIRDEGLLESALARARNLASYAAPQPSLFRLAAAYAWGLVRNHPFIDGNKRTALVVSLAFLELNGIAVNASQEDAFLTFSRLAAGLLSEEEFAAWLEKNSA